MAQIPSGAKLSIFKPNGTGPKVLADSLVVDVKPSGSAKQRRAVRRELERDGYYTLHRRGDWVAVGCDFSKGQE